MGQYLFCLRPQAEDWRHSQRDRPVAGPHQAVQGVCASCKMLEKARLLTRPTPAPTSPARPESANTASSPRDAPFRGQGRSSVADPRFTFHASRFTAAGSETRTPLVDFFSILLDIWNLPVNRSQPSIGKISVDVREAPATEKLSD